MRSATEIEYWSTRSVNFSFTVYHVKRFRPFQKVSGNCQFCRTNVERQFGEEWIFFPLSTTRSALRDCFLLLGPLSLPDDSRHKRCDAFAFELLYFNRQDFGVSHLIIQVFDGPPKFGGNNIPNKDKPNPPSL